MEKKGNKSGCIRKDTNNKMVAAVSVYQIQQSRTVLFPQLSRRLTSALIWDSQLMMDHFSDLTYVQLIRSKIQEEALAGKFSFEMQAATFGVKIHKYHSDNEIFSEQPFRTEIEDSNQKTTFCGVV